MGLGEFSAIGMGTGLIGVFVFFFYLMYKDEQKELLKKNQ